MKPITIILHQEPGSTEHMGESSYTINFDFLCFLTISFQFVDQNYGIAIIALGLVFHTPSFK